MPNEIFRSSRLPKIRTAEFMVLNARPYSISMVRKLISKHMDIGMDSNAVLSASELATNAVRYGTPENSGDVYVAGIIYTHDQKKIVFVGDCNPDFINKRDPNEGKLKEGGEGMKIVDSLSNSNGFTRKIPEIIAKSAPEVKKIIFFEPGNDELPEAA
jgi:two-component sensor histidine kinase